MSDRELLAGWGRTAPTGASVAVVAPDGVAEALGSVGPRGLIARGLGRSYGDPAQNAGGMVLAPIGSSIEFESGTGLARVDAGVSLHDLIAAALPRGWFLPVTPGTRQVTVAGAVACDVHGKNHHRSGSFGDHVREIELVMASGGQIRASPEQHSDIFWATVGGMGLTGIIVGVTVQLLPVETGWMSVSTQRLDDIEAVMATMSEVDRTHTYTVCWIDTLARGRSLGQSVLSIGEHATSEEVATCGRPLPVPGESVLGVPARVPPGLISRPAIRAFNELWFRKAPRRQSRRLQGIGGFFHPLDGVRNWNRIYGSRGFVQYQFSIPDEASEVLPVILEGIAGAGHPSFLSVLKRFGPVNQGWLSFPSSGWTLAMDLPVSAGLAPLFRDLDRSLLDVGGRIYLAKDARLDHRTAKAMYSRWDDFCELRSRIDPTGVLQSDLSRRLGL